MGDPSFYAFGDASPHCFGANVAAAPGELGGVEGEMLVNGSTDVGVDGVGGEAAGFWRRWASRYVESVGRWL